MSLHFPHSDSRILSQDNIEQLLSLGSGKKAVLDDVITPVAKEAILDYREAQLGLGHQIMKGCASTAGFLAPVTVMVAGGLGGAYYAVNNWNSLIASDENGDNPVVIALKPYAIPVAGTIAADIALERATGYSIFRPALRWAKDMFSAAGLYVSYRTSEGFASKYVKMEQVAQEVSKTSKDRLFVQLATTFNAVADELGRAFADMSDDPKKMQHLKQLAATLESKVGLVTKLLKSTPLTSSGVSQVLDKYKYALKAIRDVPFELKTEDTDEARKFNAELMTTLSEKEFASIAIPRLARHHVYLVKDNTLGFADRVKSTAKIIGNGTLTGALWAAGSAGVVGASRIAQCLYLDSTLSECLPTVAHDQYAQIVAGLAASVAFLYFAGNKVISDHHADIERRKRAAASVVANTRSAEKVLKKVYDGTAKYLSAKSGQEAQGAAESIKVKLSSVDQVVAKLGVFKKPSVVTANLRNTVNAIRSRQE